MRMILQRAHERLGDVILFNGTLKIGLVEVSFDLADETPLRDVSGAISKTKLLKRAVQLAREFARPPCPLCVLTFRCKPQSGADEQEDSAEPAGVHRDSLWVAAVECLTLIIRTQERHQCRCGRLDWPL